jgi:hypothetical protein
LQFSTVASERVAPFPKGKGICNICGSETLAKCGQKKMWHWAHKSKKDCDPWWENETEWHRNWKEKFPAAFREIVHSDEATGEKHRADIKSDNGIILEIQNSPISLEELKSRETFYKNMIWIVNAQHFQPRFRVLPRQLPDPDCKEFDDYVFVHTQNEHNCAMHWRKSRNPDFLSGKSIMVEMLSTYDIQRQIDKHYVGHHPFNWKKPHVAWLEATCPIFLDFGADILWQVVNYRNRFRCVRAITKEKVIADIIHLSDARDIPRNYTIVRNH